MLANPGKPLTECAKHLGKHPQLVYMVTGSDMYKEYFRQRREEWTRNHDAAIIGKTTKVAEAALDLMLEKLEKQADKIPMQLVAEVATSALDRLGYAPKRGPAVEVRVDQSDNRQVVVNSVSIGALEEARDALRVAEQQRAATMRELESTAAEAAVEQSSDSDGGDSDSDA
jgi:hypothetical protein